jgi:hypothetical protein
MKEKMPFNFYFFRFLTVLILVSLFFLMPGKSKIFDNWIFFSKAVAGGGLLFLAHYLWNFYKKDPGKEAPEYVICKNCKTPQDSKDLIKGRCAKCSGIVVKLEGYYDRHPKKHQRNPEVSDRPSSEK